MPRSIARILRGVYICITLISVSSVAKGPGPQDLHLVNGCRVMDAEGKTLTTFPGNICLFNPDGTFISASNEGLRKFGKNDELLWAVEGHFHHQINFSLGKTAVLALASEVIPWEGEKLRLDRIIIVGQDGQVKASVRADELFRQAGIKLHKFETEPALLAAIGAKSESSHFNSFYEIPLTVEIGNPRARYVVNSLTSGTFLLTEDLQRVVRHFRLETSQDHQVHDVQFLENGNLFYFNNIRKESRPGYQSSAIQEFDLKTRRVVTEFTSEPATFFYSRFGGGTQRLPGNFWLFSDMLTATHIVDMNKRKLVKSITGTHHQPGRPFGVPTFQVKAYDLREFFRSRKRGR